LLTTGLVCWVLGLQVAGRWREARRAAALVEARDALVSSQRERERLSHDLHDGAIQSLYAVQLGLTRAATEAGPVAGPAGQRLIESRANLDAVIGELRQFMGALDAGTPPPPSHGLAAVLESIVRRLRPASPATIELLCDAATARRLDAVQAMQLAAVAREALSNRLRHARARRITVRLASEGTVAVLEVRDNGAGFDPATSAGKGIGMASLRRRAESLGGRIEVASAPGAGTTITVRTPMRAADSTKGAEASERTRS
jgi:signal transduction histidine kinase